MRKKTKTVGAGSNDGKTSDQEEMVLYKFVKDDVSPGSVQQDSVQQTCNWPITNRRCFAESASILQQPVCPQATFWQCVPTSFCVASVSEHPTPLAMCPRLALVWKHPTPLAMCPQPVPLHPHPTHLAMCLQPVVPLHPHPPAFSITNSIFSFNVPKQLFNQSDCDVTHRIVAAPPLAAFGRSHNKYRPVWLSTYPAEP